MELNKPTYYYEPTDTILSWSEPALLKVHFGRATTNLMENTEETRWIEQTFNSIIQQQSVDQLNILIDLSAVGSGEYNSDESNAIYKRIVRDPHIKKIAVYGLSLGWDLLVGIFRFYAKVPIRTFVTEQQAYDWLQSTD